MEDLVDALAHGVEDGVIYEAAIQCTGHFVNGPESKKCPTQIKVAASILGDATLSISTDDMTSDSRAIYAGDVDMQTVYDEDAVGWGLQDIEGARVDVMLNKGSLKKLDVGVPMQYHQFNPMGLSV